MFFLPLFIVLWFPLTRADSNSIIHSKTKLVLKSFYLCNYILCYIYFFIKYTVIFGILECEIVYIGKDYINDRVYR